MIQALACSNDVEIDDMLLSSIIFIRFNVMM